MKRFLLPLSLILMTSVVTLQCKTGKSSKDRTTQKKEATAPKTVQEHAQDIQQASAEVAASSDCTDPSKAPVIDAVCGMASDVATDTQAAVDMATAASDTPNMETVESAMDTSTDTATDTGTSPSASNPQQMQRTSSGVAMIVIGSIMLVQGIKGFYSLAKHIGNLNVGFNSKKYQGEVDQQKVQVQDTKMKRLKDYFTGVSRNLKVGMGNTNKAKVLRAANRIGRLAGLIGGIAMIAVGANSMKPVETKPAEGLQLADGTDVGSAVSNYIQTLGDIAQEIRNSN